MASFISKLGLDSATKNFLKDRFEYKSLTFPQELQEIGSSSNHAVVFHIWERNGSKFSLSQGGNGPAGSSQVQDNNGNARTRTSNGGRGVGGLLDGLKKFPGVTENDVAPLRNNGSTYLIKRTIVLYVPSKLTTNYNADWGDTSLRKEESFLDSLGSASDIVKNLGAATLESAIRKIDSALCANILDLLSLTSGMAANPHLETLFRGVDFRTFSFSFKMVPKNQKEANIIANIEKTFRFYMQPENVEGLGRYFRFPSEFSIEFISYGKPNAFLNRIGNCVLTGMSVDRTAAGIAAFHRQIPRNDDFSGGVLSNIGRGNERDQFSNDNSEGSPPVATQLDLSFREVEVLTKNKVKDFDY